MKIRGLKLIPLITSIMIIVIVFHKAIEGAIFSSSSTVIDEVAVLLITSMAFFLQLNRGVLKSSFAFIILVGIYLIIISISFGENNSYFAIIGQSFLYLQFFLLLISLSIIHENYPGFVSNTFLIILIVSLLGCIIQIAFPSLFASIFGDTDYILGGDSTSTLRVEGFQKNPNSIGILLSMFMILIMFRPKVIKNRIIRNFVFFFALFMLLDSGSRSAMIFLVVAFIFMSSSIKRKILIASVGFAAIFATGIMEVTYEKTQENIAQIETGTDNKYIRWLMTYHGTMLAIDNFPIGVGAGTFGSAFSHESPVYDRLGLASLASVQEGRGIHDSNYGSIAGEFGVIGLVLFFGLNILFIRQIINRKNMSIYSDFKDNKKFIKTIIFITLLAPFMRPLFSSSYYGVIVSLLILSFIEKSFSSKVITKQN